MKVLRKGWFMGGSLLLVNEMDYWEPVALAP
jgi:hypothetical protein